MAYDANWDKVPLLMHFDGESGSAAIINEVTGLLATLNGNTALSQSQFRFGNASVYFDGTEDWLEMPYSPLYDPGSTDFTVELWTYCTQYNASTSSMLCGTYSSGSVEGGTGNAGWEFGLAQSTGYLFFGWGGGGSWTTIISSSTPLPRNVWCHVALCKVGDQFTIYLNGTSIGTASYSTPVTITKTKFKMGGAQQDGSHYFFYYGYIDELRITKGLARYTANFTPPTEKFPYPIPDLYWDRDSLLMHFNGDNNSTVFMSEVGRQLATANGDAKISTTQSKFGGSSAYFDGTGDYLALPHSTSLSLGTGDLTIEAWIYPTTFNTMFWAIASKGTSGSNGFFLGLRPTEGYLRWDLAGTIYTSATAPTLNTWSHIAWTRSGSINKGFINGVEVYTFTDSTNFDDTGEFRIGRGRTTSSNYATGYIDELRITKGLARYSPNFDPPLTELLSDANTSLLLKCNGANNSTTFIDSSSYNHSVSVTGDAKISSAQSKFGGSSAYFDGSGDYLTIAHSTDLSLGTGDFTIEAWWYPMSNSTGNISGMSKVSASSETGWAWGVYNGIWRFSTYSTVIFYTGTVALNSWSHVAIVRSSGVLTLFINGIHIATNSNSFDFIDTADLLIGTIQGANNFYGYLDDIRITKGLARYTANFTVPDKEFYYPYSPYWAANALLMHFNGDNNSTTFYDEMGHTPAAVTGNAKISTTQSKFGGSSGYFDGTSDSIRFYGGNIPLGLNDFTVEMFVYLDLASMSSGWERLFQIGSGSNDTTNGTFNIVRYGTSNPMGIQVEYYNSAWVVLLQVTDVGIQPNTWYNLSVTRESGVFRVFVNGVLKGSNTPASANLTQTVITLGCGGSNSYCIRGYLDELRITNGYARYTADFLVPTLPHILPAPSYQFGSDQEFFDYLGDTTQKNILSIDNTYYRELTPFDDNGVFKVEGLTTIKGVPVITDVFLFTLADKRLIATTRSNALGEYSFTNLKNQPYFVWARDETDDYNPVSRIAQNTL